MSGVHVSVLARHYAVEPPVAIAKTFSHFRLRVLRPPFEAPSVVLRYVWHRRVAEDSGVAFLRSLIRLTLSDFPKTLVKSGR